MVTATCNGETDTKTASVVVAVAVRPPQYRHHHAVPLHIVARGLRPATLHGEVHVASGEGTVVTRRAASVPPHTYTVGLGPPLLLSRPSGPLRLRHLAAQAALVRVPRPATATDLLRHVAGAGRSRPLPGPSRPLRHANATCPRLHVGLPTPPAVPPLPQAVGPRLLRHVADKSRIVSYTGATPAVGLRPLPAPSLPPCVVDVG